jgi:methylglutamate dehydrogenase subunit A
MGVVARRPLVARTGGQGRRWRGRRGPSGSGSCAGRRGRCDAYSGWQIFRNALAENRLWRPVWRDPVPKEGYDVVIIGGGGHGLSTAFYLAKNHGVRRVAVVEKGYLGSGNIGRNTTIVRANYLLPGNSEFYSLSLKLWEGLEAALNYNVMMSQRGLINLCHSDGQFDAFARRGNAMRFQGDDAELLTRDGVRKIAPFLNFEDPRFPIYGGLMQRRAGTARHDAVAWGYARAADGLGVDLIQNCEVTGSASRGARSEASRRRGASSARRRSASSRRGGRARSRRWRASSCRSRATCCRPSSPRG